jgi:hypothetical protein
MTEGNVASVASSMTQRYSQRQLTFADDDNEKQSISVVIAEVHF